MHTAPVTVRRLRFAGLVAVAFAAATMSRAEKPIALSPWSVSLMGGTINFEGDEPVADAPLYTIRLGRDYDARWTFEGEFSLAPELDEAFRYDVPTGERVSRLEEVAGPGVHDTWSMRLTAEALYHLGARERVDPFLAFGVGAAWYEDGFAKDLQPLIQGGAGCLYHLRDSWALRTDVRFSFSDQATEANGMFLIGLQWSPSPVASVAPSQPAAVPAQPPAVVPAPAPAPAPTVEAAPDTDRDGLTDAEETNTTHTDPLRADSDWDALSDGDEVHKHKTDPLKRDTDGGGVYDGHEVIEDGTKPLERQDDRMVYELQFDYEPDDWHIKAEYFSEIGVIGKILKDDTAATARIEGHVDTTVKDPMPLSEKRAQAVSDALVQDWGIDIKRLTSVGYGTSRPKGPSIPPAGNAANTRIEVYLPAQTK